MSARSLADYCAYLGRAANAAPSALPGLAADLLAAAVRRLPVDALYEPLACPVVEMVDRDDLFRVPDENSFFVDLLGPDGAQDVLCARELRDRLGAHLDRPDARIWLVSDAYTSACRSALHVERCPDAAYRLRALFVGERDLAEGTLPDCLLLGVLALADQRRAELRAEALRADPLVRLLFGVLGFLRHGGELVRLPTSHIVASGDTLDAVEGQIAALWAAHAARLTAPG